MHQPRARQEEYLQCRRRPSRRRRPPGADRARFWAWRHGSDGASIGRWTSLLGRAGTRSNAHLLVANPANGTYASPQPVSGRECTRRTGRKWTFPSGKTRFSANLWWSIPKGRNTVFYRGPNSPRWLWITPGAPPPFPGSEGLNLVKVLADATRSTRCPPVSYDYRGVTTGAWWRRPAPAEMAARMYR